MCPQFFFGKGERMVMKKVKVSWRREGKRPRCRAFIIILIALCLMLTPLVEASQIALGLWGSYFYPREEIFRDIYDPGAQFGGDIVYTFWVNYGLFLRANYYQKDGQLTFTQDKTKVKILPVTLGFRYHVTGKRMEGYLDLGLGLFHFEEENPIGRANVNKLGYLASGGLSFYIYKGLFLGLRADYTHCQVKPFELEAQIGGLALQVGLGYRFQLTPEEESWVWKEVK